MSAHVTASVHVDGTDHIRAGNSGRCVWVEIGPDATVFPHSIEQINAIIDAFVDARTRLAEAQVKSLSS